MLEWRLPWLHSIRFVYDKSVARGWICWTAAWQVEEEVAEEEMVSILVEVIAECLK